MATKFKNAADKQSQFFASIDKQKLDTLRWCMLHSGMNTRSLINEESGMTALQQAAAGGKDKALLVMLDIFRQQRAIADAVDVATEDGNTPLMLAIKGGHAACVDHLIYYGASLKAKNEAGQSAADLAAKCKNAEIKELIDEELNPKPVTAAAVEEDVDADGLNSTQRSRLKKKALKDAERKGFMAAVHAAAAASGGGAGGEGGEGGGEGAPAGGEGGAAAPAAAAPAAEPVWPELVAALAAKRREFNLVKPSECGTAIVGVTGEAGDVIDPALWGAVLLNRVELKLPGLTVLPPALGALTALQTLILAGNGLTSLPETLASCVDLKFLDVSDNALTSLPAAVGKLPKLEVLAAPGNALTDLSPLALSTSLLKLSLDRNPGLVSLEPLNFGGLARLDTLTAAECGLTGLPETIGAAASLAVLNVGKNAITELPAGLAGLNQKKVKTLELLPNPIADKKVLKILGNRPEKVVKELFKYLEEEGGAGGKKGGGKRK